MLVGTVPVRIKIHSTTRDESGVLPAVIQEHQGMLLEKNGKFYAMYQENSQENFGLTKTTIKWEKDRVLILRSGALEHRQEFMKDMRQESLYRTPYMEIPLVTTTSYVYCFQRDKRWNLEVEYTLAHGDNPYGQVKLLIEIEEV